MITIDECRKKKILELTAWLFFSDPEAAEYLDTLVQRVTGCRFGVPEVCTENSHPDCWKNVGE